MRQEDAGENELKQYLELSPQVIRENLVAIQARLFPNPGQRQEPFNAVETLLCYGLFQVVNPHGYGGSNKDKMPEVRLLQNYFALDALLQA
jgi:putative restriction endonuclease